MSAVVLICTALLMSDGDSGRCVTADGERHRVRLAGIDAGEVAPFTRCRQRPDVWACSPVARSLGPSSSARARQLSVHGARCTITSSDRYGRNVAVCTAGGRDIGATLVREGLAISDTNFGDPNRREENAARRERRGVWR